MKNLKKLAILSLAALTVTACNGAKAEYKRGEDEDVYGQVLPEFEGLVAAAQATTNTTSERYAKYAKAEAYLMDSALVLPTYSRGGSYSVSRIAPRSVPYVMWGNDADHVKSLVAVKYNADKLFIKPAERAEMIALWDAARKGGADYDPIAYLEGKGYEIDDEYHYYYTSNPETFDYLATSKQRDTLFLVQGVEGLFEYDNYGVQQPRIAKAIPTVENGGISADLKTYTFEIEEGHKWLDAEGKQYGTAEVTADDFVAGFQHMLDAKGGLHTLTAGVIKGVTEYLKGEKGFNEVGVKAVDGKLVIELLAPEAFFLSRLGYTCFLPMNRAFYESKGGKFGSEYDPTDANYTYGKVGTASSILYNSAYRFSTYTKDSKIEMVANNLYDDYENVTFKKLTYNFEDLKNRSTSYGLAKSGTYVGWGLTASGGVLDAAKADGIFASYAFITDTDSTTFFGGMNVNRGTFEVGSVKSAKTEQQKIDTQNAMLNPNFRRALQHAWDRKTWNAVSVAEELATASMRNMYTPPEFCSLTEKVTLDGHEFTAGTTYGEIVEYFLKNTYNRKVTIRDGQDGWYNKEAALEFAKLAKEELEAAKKWNDKVIVEVVYNSQDDDSTKSAKAYENVVEGAIGDYVDVVCVEAASEEDQLATSYDAASGIDCCYDISWDSGWGPDYGDPSTYVDTYLPGGQGYMTKLSGLW